ncbi:hypothetical protein [Bacillus mobilis]|uniref:hypothetical protein n=1 Tax=Bacillus mobilis TaxID=2026190 RepID=UPI0036C0A162
METTIGSALLGAMVGGGITYAIAKAKERKEEREKRLESLFEIQSAMLILIHKFNKTEAKVEKNHYLNNGEIEVEIPFEKSSFEKLVDIVPIENLINELKEELINFRPTLLGNTVHMGEKVYLEIYEQFETIWKMYNHFANQAGQDASKLGPYYKKETLNNIVKVNERMRIMYINLEHYEKKYVSHYTKKIVGK